MKVYRYVQYKCTSTAPLMGDLEQPDPTGAETRNRRNISNRHGQGAGCISLRRNAKAVCPRSSTLC